MLSQYSELEAILKSTEYLLTTAATGSEASLNVSFLTRLFETEQTKHVLLCRSTLFDWARAEAWGHLSIDRRKRELYQAADDPIKNSEDSEGGFRTALEDSVQIQMESAQPEDAATEALGAFDEGNNAKNGDDMATFWNRSPHSLRQLSARLHCLYGVSISTLRKHTISPARYSLRSDTASLVAYARSAVYDLRQQTDHTFWGPFLDDGLQTVDWEKMEAIMIVLDHNLKLSIENNHVCEGMKLVKDKPFDGATPKSFVSQPSSLPMEPAIPLEAQDPYGITGTWMRVVCVEPIFDPLKVV